MFRLRRNRSRSLPHKGSFMEINGTIIRALSGFYYVEAAGTVYECRARGAFRKEGVSPLVGDSVTIETDGEKGTVVKIGERKNYLLRPPVANLDRLFIVSSVKSPEPNIFVIDKMTVFAEKSGIEPVIVFSKCELDDAQPLCDIYEKCGFSTVKCSSVTGEGLDKIAALISGCRCAFTGNSGVGKSSLINALVPDLSLETNGISEKLGRGRHTTRSVSLYSACGGYIADTPGFSSFEQSASPLLVDKEELAEQFPEFRRFIMECRFYPSCSHTRDKGCAVCEAVKNGEIPASRHESYLRMYEEVKNIKAWD